MTEGSCNGRGEPAHASISISGGVLGAAARVWSPSFASASAQTHFVLVSIFLKLCPRARIIALRCNASSFGVTELLLNRCDSDILEFEQFVPLVSQLRRDANVRVALSERDTCSSNDYTSPNGLQFAMSCSETIVDFDFSTSVANSTQTDIYACANHCSISRMCYFAVFNNTDKNCMWSNKPVSFTFTQDVEIDVAAVDPTTQLTVQYDTACPYANLTTVTTYNGMEAEVYCGLDNLAPDYCPTGNSSWVCPSHATSFQQCLDICSESHPLCWGIAYDPTLITGYANCYLKNSLPTPDELPLTGALNTAQYNGAILHAAVVTEKNGSSIPINCTNDAEINAQDGQTFVTFCNLTQLDNDLWQVHENSLQSCIDECVTYNGEKCVAVVYDPQLNNGWENCYLKNSTTVNTQSVGMTLALVSTSSGSIPSSSGSPGGSQGSSTGGSKAWIAGPVIGGIFVLVAAAYGIFWWRKRSTSSRNRTSEQHPQRRAKVEGRTPGWEMDERRQRMYLSEMPSTGTIEGLVAQASV